MSPGTCRPPLAAVVLGRIPLHVPIVPCSQIRSKQHAQILPSKASEEAQLVLHPGSLRSAPLGQTYARAEPWQKLLRHNRRRRRQQIGTVLPLLVHRPRQRQQHKVSACHRRIAPGHTQQRKAAAHESVSGRASKQRRRRRRR